MKKSQKGLIFLILIALIVIGVKIYDYEENQPHEGPVQPTGNIVANTDEPHETPGQPIVNGVTSVDQLTGVWQTSPYMAAGWSTLYQFFPSGKYNYRISQMQCVTRDIGHSGYWTIAGSKIELTKITKTTIFGDNLGCGPSGGFMGGTIQTQKYEVTQTEELNLKPCLQSESDHYACLSINEQQFYKFSSDPSYGNSSDLWKEPIF